MWAYFFPPCNGARSKFSVNFPYTHYKPNKNIKNFLDSEDDPVRSRQSSKFSCCLTVVYLK